MMHRFETPATMDSASWTWHVIPLLIVAAALSVVFMPQGHAPAEAAALGMDADVEATRITQLLVPSPQPGESEPELVVADLPQSY
jgi:hypothetical protein